MEKTKWWLAFLGYASLYCVASSCWWVLYPFRMAQIEMGATADFLLMEMKRMVHDENYNP